MRQKPDIGSRLADSGTDRDTRGFTGEQAMGERPQVTNLLDAVGRGEAAAQRELYELAYHELKRIARSTLKKAA